VLRRARQNPEELVIGIDADAAAMADASRRAAASPRRGGLPNALFLAAPAAELPGPLAGRVDYLTIALPWGSLLRGILQADATMIGRLCATLREGAQIEILLSATERDAATAGVTLGDAADGARLAARLESAGLRSVQVRTASESDVNRLSSGWGRRLGIPARRQAWLLSARARPVAEHRPNHVPCNTRRAVEQARSAR
jgi:16S rRNA (adenine(1408)-N(1))-methyltransferase